MRRRYWLGVAFVFFVAGAARCEIPPQLSFTPAQVDSGRSEYTQSCNDCHGPHLDDGEFGGPPLKGPAFIAKWLRLPPSTLVNYVHNTMPPDTPGRLPTGTYVEIVAYILSVNGISPGTKEMPTDTAALAALRYPQMH